MQASYEISLARLTAEGMLDASFNRLSPTPGWLLVDPGPDGDHYHNILDLVQVDDGHLLAAGGRTRRPPITPNDTLAEVYRFNGFDAAPHPIPLYPMSAPPAWVAHLVILAAAGGATATQPAVRVPTP